MYQGKSIKRKINPRENASIFNIAWFIYTWAVFKIGIKREIQEDDIFEVMQIFGSERVTDKLEKEWEKELKKPTQSIIKALFRSFGRQYMYLGVFSCIYKVAYMTIKPISIAKIVQYFVPGQTSVTLNDAYFYAAVLVSLKFVVELLRHQYAMYLDHVSIKLKAALCSLVYRKALRINDLSGDADVSAGRIMTIISKDVDVFEIAVFFAHDIWVGIIEVIIMCFMMYRAIGDATFMGVGFLICIIPVQFWVGKITATGRYKASERTDERLRLMQEIFATIKLIKIYTWDKFFTSQGVKARKNEMIKLRFLFILKATVISIGFISAKLSFYICMMYFIYTGNNLTAETAYLVISCYEILRWVLGISIPQNIARMGESMSCLKRIRQFLTSSEIPVQYTSKDTEKVHIHIKNVKVQAGGTNDILHDINVELKHGLVGVTGSVGSGKSTLLKTMLQDVLLVDGSVNTSGVISYASQEPWIFPGTIRQNIIFGLEFDEKRYHNTIRLCALEKDISNWPHRDSFVVIDRGLNISRGQQARVNLARSIYRNADIYLLDDSLSALDSVVSEHVFRTCISDFLSEKLVVLVTHNTNILRKCDSILYMKNGTISNRGTYTELESFGVDFGDCLHSATAEIINNKEASYIENQEEKDLNSSESTALLEADNIDSTEIYKENHKEGKVDFDIYKLYFQTAGGFIFLIPVLFLFILAQGSGTYFDYFIGQWVDLEQNRTNYITSNRTNTTEYENMVEKYSFARMMYTVFIIVATIFNTCTAFSFFALTTRASREIHDLSFKKIMGATMEFFDQNLPGNVLNRFSKDFNVIDEQVPNHIFDCVQILFIMIGIAVNITLTNTLFIIPTILFAGLLYTIRCYYIQTGRSLHRLNGITRAPMIGHLNASLDGLTTIRSSGNQKLLKYQFDRHQDLNTSVLYSHIATARAFRFYMDLIAGVYIALIVYSFLLFDNNAMAGMVGLAITQSFGLTGVLQWGIRQWSQIENRMTSVERIMEYATLKQENRAGESIKNWPNEGKLEYSNVTMCYTNSDEPVLRNISFIVQPKEKVGIIGRTGAGKSSILSALFRLYQTEGIVTVDNVDISTIALDEARSNISIIPQDPVLFSGTLRSNLDPYNIHGDDKLWRALKEVDMTSVTDLDGIINDGGSNFSIGQRQLICLARAILRNNKILVLDEATANVDPHTDALMQETITRVFKDCTMLIIAHRLNTVMGCDKVMVVDGGTVVEFDTPQGLLKNTDGIFYNLVKSSGLHMKTE